MKIESLKMVATRLTGRGGLVVRKYSPEILLGVGIVGVVTSTIMACKATTKAEKVLDEAKDKLVTIRTAHATVTAEEYSEKDYKKDLIIVYTQTGVGFVKTYGPAITLGLASIGCILGAHNIMRRRNIAILAAYKAVEQNFSKYRKRVIEELGDDKDRQFRTGIRKETITVTEKDTKGNDKQVKKEIEVVDPNGISEYAKIFDDTNRQWSDVPDYNLMFLKCQQQHANDLLHARGHVFLNEVYDMLGFEHTPAGAITGWVKGHGDDFVDFGMFDTTVSGYVDDHVNDTIGEQRRDFVNGKRAAVLLDFNVAGVIYDMI